MMLSAPVVPFVEPPDAPPGFEIGWLGWVIFGINVATILVFLALVVGPLRWSGTHKVRNMVRAAVAILFSLVLLWVYMTIGKERADTRSREWTDEVDALVSVQTTALEEYYRVELTGYVQLPWSETSVQEVEVTTAHGATTDCLLHVLPDPDVSQRLAISCGGTDLNSATELEPAP